MANITQIGGYGNRWSHDGERIVYVENNRKLIIIKSNGTFERQINFTDPLNVDMPDWSIDDAKLVFYTYAPNAIDNLHSYVQQGGILLPDLTTQQTKLTNTDIDNLLLKLDNSTGYQAIADTAITTLDFDHKKIDVGNTKHQWLVLS